MKSVFLDTSGFYAFLCADDPSHGRAIDLFHRAERESWDLSTTSLVFHETSALVQHRVGREALDCWIDQIVPRCRVTWVDEELGRLGVARWRQARSRLLSLTDCVSFAFMAERGIREAIAFDAHFARQGFALP